MFAAYGAAVVPLQLNPQSRQPDLNRKPAVYETAALPLRYDGRKKVDNRKRSGASGLEDRYAANYTMPTYGRRKCLFLSPLLNFDRLFC